MLLLQALVQQNFSLMPQFIEDLQDLCSKQEGEAEEVDAEVLIRGVYRQVMMVGSTQADLTDFGVGVTQKEEAHID